MGTLLMRALLQGKSGFYPGGGRPGAGMGGAIPSPTGKAPGRGVGRESRGCPGARMGKAQGTKGTGAIPSPYASIGLLLRQTLHQGQSSMPGRDPTHMPTGSVDTGFVINIYISQQKIPLQQKCASNKIEINKLISLFGETCPASGRPHRKPGTRADSSDYRYESHQFLCEAL